MFFSVLGQPFNNLDIHSISLSGQDIAMNDTQWALSVGFPEFYTGIEVLIRYYAQ